MQIQMACPLITPEENHKGWLPCSYIKTKKVELYFLQLQHT